MCTSLKKIKKKEYKNPNEMRRKTNLKKWMKKNNKK